MDGSTCGKKILYLPEKRSTERAFNTSFMIKFKLEFYGDANRGQYAD